MYQVIARKYRPQSFRRADRPGARRTTLENAIAQRPHRPRLHLFGPARHGQNHRRAHSGALPELHRRTHRHALRRVRQLPRNRRRGIAVDVIEIDAASNRGINEMRELRENVRYRPARDRYKVFIVDEAHQITSEAFNALLKTLEEPPEWAVFILCTTEVAQDSDHHRVALPAVQLPLGGFRGASRAHGMDLQAGRHRGRCRSLSVLAQAGEGSVRDSLSALDQAIACCGNEAQRRGSARLLGHVLARFAGRR
jgi:DNA polymerase III subunit gamma/tau